MPDKNGTDVSKLLKENGMDSLIDIFYNAEYYDVEDLTEEIIKTLLPAEKPGTIARLIRKVKEKQDEIKRAKDAINNKKTPPMPDIPHLPAGTTLDLSKSDFTFNNVPFSIPTELGINYSDKEIVAPGTLNAIQWLTIIQSNSLTFASNMTDALNPDSKKHHRADKPVVDWVYDEKDISFYEDMHLAAVVYSAVSYTEESANLVAAGYTKEDAGIGFPFCALSFENSNKVHTNSLKASKSVYMTGVWEYPRVRLILKERTKVTQAFLDCIDNALAKQRDDEKTSALQEAFDTYGHAFPVDVTLGGRLYFVHSEQSSADISDETYERLTTIAINAMADNAKGGGGFVNQEGNASYKKVLEQMTSNKFQAIGGDTTLASSPSNWPETVKKPENWAVIDYNKLVRTVDLLPAAKRDEVLKYWKAPEVIEKDPFDYKTVFLSPMTSDQQALNWSPGFLPVYTTPTVFTKDNDNAIWRFIRCRVIDEKNVYWIQHIKTGQLLTECAYEEKYGNDFSFHGTLACAKIPDDPYYFSNTTKVSGQLYRITPLRAYSNADRFADLYIIEYYDNPEKLLYMGGSTSSLSEYGGRTFLKQANWCCMDEGSFGYPLTKLQKILTLIGDPDKSDYRAIAWKIIPIND